MADIARAPAFDMAGKPEPAADALAGYTPAHAGGTTARNLLIFLFFTLLIIPVNFDINTYRISPYRAYLLVAFFPLVISWAIGLAGRFRLTDFLVMGFACWSWIATQVNNGSTFFNISSMLVVETIAAYLLGRLLVRNLSNHKTLANCLFMVLLLLVPFAYLEATRVEQIYAPLFSSIGTPIAFAGIDMRWGLNRSQVAFEHPILYGLFCGTAFAILYYAPRRNNKGISGVRRAWIAPLATFFSLSAGAYGPVLLQTALIGFNTVFEFIKARWKLAALGCVILYILLDILSNRTPLQVIGSNLAFNQNTYFYRVLINQYGMDNVRANPIFGLGFRPWVRPSFMSSGTVDNFWLLTAMRYGIPGFLLLFSAYIFGIWKLTWANLPVRLISMQRYALAFSLAGLLVGAATVFLWNGVYVYVLFLLGATSWLVEEGERVTRLEASGVDVTRAGAAEKPKPERSRKRRIIRTRSELTSRKNVRYTRARPEPGSEVKPEREPRHRRKKRSAIATDEPRKPVRYSRVEPRGPKDRDNKEDPDKGH